MLFMEGKDRSYERMMQQKTVRHEKRIAKPTKPGRKPYSTDYRYTYSDFDCAYCADRQKKICPHAICPHIMGNLEDLLNDPAFIAEMAAAERCDTPHRNTLLALYEKYFGATAAHGWEGFDAEKKQPQEL